MNKLEIKIENRNGLNVVSSRTIAEQLGKRHSAVIEQIEKILANQNLGSLIIKGEYKDLQGKPRKEYLLTKDGFNLYMFNIQGYVDYKMAYINRFNEMERIINNIPFELLSEDGKRLVIRKETRNYNKLLFDSAKKAGVETNIDFAIFNNYGYKGLYNGETANDIKDRKGLKKNENILDHMGSTELVANLFRITQTDEVLKKGNVKDKTTANNTHFKVGQKVRETMIDISGIAPEQLPTPEKSIKEIEKEIEKKKKTETKKSITKKE